MGSLAQRGAQQIRSELKREPHWSKGAAGRQVGGGGGGRKLARLTPSPLCVCATQAYLVIHTCIEVSVTVVMAIRVVASRIDTEGHRGRARAAI